MKAPLPCQRVSGFEDLRAEWTQRQLGTRLGARSSKTVRRLIVVLGTWLGMSFQGQVGVTKSPQWSFGRKAPLTARKTRTIVAFWPQDAGLIEENN